MTTRASITGEDDAGNSVTATGTIEVIELVGTTISLEPGSNLISLRGFPLSTNINDIIGPELTTVDLVVGYDATAANPFGRTAVRDPDTGFFVGDLTTIVPGKVYWVNTSAAVDLVVAIPEQEPLAPLPLIVVKGGVYNGIGVWLVQTRDPDGNRITDVVLDDYLGTLDWRVAFTFDPNPAIGWQVFRPGDRQLVSTGTGLLVYFDEDDVFTPA